MILDNHAVFSEIIQAGQANTKMTFNYKRIFISVDNQHPIRTNKKCPAENMRQGKWYQYLGDKKSAFLEIYIGIIVAAFKQFFHFLLCRLARI